MSTHLPHPHHPDRRVLGQRTDPPNPSRYVLGRHRARFLDPVTAPRDGEHGVRSTAYTADRLIVPAGDDGAAALKVLEEVAKGLRLEEDTCHLFCQGGRDIDPEDDRLARAYRLVPDGAGSVAPDAWAVLEAARAKNAKAVARVTLDHLMFGPSIGGTIPHTSGHGTDGPLALASYGEVGSGGRQVVSWVGADPVRTAMPDEDRPQVALFDTGCGEHPWLAEGVVRYRVGRQGDADDPEKYADQESPLLGELDSHSGHGTFSAGIVRQGCPDADVLSVRVMGSDGVVQEWETLHALQVLRSRVHRWVHGRSGGVRVDVVVLPLGYYHETPLDPTYTALLGDVLRGLGDLGVVVVTAAGNDATTRPFYPAAMSPHADEVTGEERDRAPVIAVGSRNPDGSTLALFNNHGAWVRVWRPGVSLVSTVPVTMRGALQPTLRLPEVLDGEDAHRATIDDDDFTGGFAVWSGTSFAAPVLAAELARELLRLDTERTWGAEDRVERAWAAVEALTSLHRGDS
ncbi:S8/S53 family peptidase [Thalassiella azotivora]